MQGMDRLSTIGNMQSIPRSMKKISYVNLDSRNRNRELQHNTNDYTISLEEPLYGVSSVQLVSAEIPKTDYLIDSSDDTIQVAVDLSIDYGSTSLIGDNNVQIVQLDAVNYPMKYAICYLDTGNLSSVVIRIVDLSVDYSPIKIHPYSSAYSIVNPTQSSNLDSFSLESVFVSRSSVRSVTSVITAYSKMSTPGGFVRVSSVDLAENSISHGSESVLPGVSGFVRRKSGAGLSNQRLGIAYVHNSSSTRLEMNVGGTGATDTETRLTNSVAVSTNVESYRISALSPPGILGGCVIAYVTPNGLHIGFVGVGQRNDNYRVTTNSILISSSILSDGSYSITSVDTMFVCAYVSDAKVHLVCGSIYTSNIHIEHTSVVSEILESNPYIDCCLTHDCNVAYVVSSDGSNLILREVNSTSGVPRLPLSLSPGALVRFYMDGVSDFYFTDAPLGGESVLDLRVRGASRGIGKTSFRESDVVGEGTEYVVLHIPQDADTTDLFHYQSISHMSGGSTVSINTVMTSTMSVAVGYSGSHYVNNDPFEWGCAMFTVPVSNSKLNPRYVAFPKFTAGSSFGSATPFGAVYFDDGGLWTYKDGLVSEWAYWGGAKECSKHWPGGRHECIFVYSNGCAYLFGGLGVAHTGVGEPAFSPLFTSQLLDNTVEFSEFRTDTSVFDSLVVYVTDESGVSTSVEREGISSWTGVTGIPSLLGKTKALSIGPSSVASTVVTISAEVVNLSFLCMSIDVSRSANFVLSISNSSSVNISKTLVTLRAGRWNLISEKIDARSEAGETMLVVSISNSDDVYSLVMCDTHIVPETLSIGCSSSTAICQVDYSLDGIIIETDTRIVRALMPSTSTEILDELWRIRVDEKTLNAHIVQYGYYNTVSARKPITLLSSTQPLDTPHTTISREAVEGVDGVLSFTGQEIVLAQQSGVSINSIGSNEFSLSARIRPDKYIVQFIADYYTDLSDKVFDVVPVSSGTIQLSGSSYSVFTNGGSVSISSMGYLQYTLPYLATYSFAAFIRCNVQPNMPYFTYLSYQDLQVRITNEFTIELVQHDGTVIVSSPVNYNMWIHIYVERTASTVSLYVNDTLIITSSMPATMVQPSGYLTLNASATLSGMVTAESRQVGNASIYSWVWVWRGGGRGVLHRQGVPYSRNHVIAGASSNAIPGNRVMLYISNYDFKLHAECMSSILTHTLTDSEAAAGVYVTLRRKGNRIYLYVNGVESSQTSLSYGVNISDEMYIGGEKVNNGVTNMYSGEISLVKLVINDSISTNVYTDADMLWVKKPITYGVFETDSLAARMSMGAGMVDTTGNIWVFGGRGTSGLHNDLWSYDITSEVWVKYGTGQANETIPSDGLNPGARMNFSCAISENNNIFVFGGKGNYTGTAAIYNDLWKYTITGASAGWSLMSGGPGISVFNETPTTPGTRTGGSGVCVGDSFVMLGGHRWTGITSGVNMYFTQQTEDTSIWYWSNTWTHYQNSDSVIYATMDDEIGYHDIRFSESINPGGFNAVAFWTSAPYDNNVFNMVSASGQWVNQLNGFVQEKNLDYVSVARLRLDRVQASQNALGIWSAALIHRTLALPSAFEGHLEILPLPRRNGTIVLHYGGAKLVVVDVEVQSTISGVPPVTIFDQVVLSLKSDDGSSSIVYYAYTDVSNNNYGVLGEITISNSAVSYGSTVAYASINPSRNVALSGLQESGFAVVGAGDFEVSVSHWNGNTTEDTTVAMRGTGDHTIRFPSSNRIPTRLTDLKTFNVNANRNDLDNSYYNDFYTWVVSSVLTSSTSSTLRISVQRLLHTSPVDIVQNVVGESIVFLQTPIVLYSHAHPDTHVKTLAMKNGTYSTENETMLALYTIGNELLLSYLNLLYYDPSNGLGSPPSQASVSGPRYVHVGVLANAFRMCEIEEAVQSTVAVCYITTSGSVDIRSYTWMADGNVVIGDIFTIRTEAENIDILDIVDERNHIDIVLDSNTNTPEIIKIRYSHSSNTILFGGNTSGTKWKRIGFVEPSGDRIYDNNLSKRLASSLIIGNSDLAIFSPGIQWVDVGVNTPLTGTQILNTTLESFLTGSTTTLTRTQLESTGIVSFSTSNYVHASGKYYRPLGYFEPDRLSWRLIGSTQPDGIRLVHAGLELALITSHKISPSQWSSFMIAYVHIFNYVFSNGYYYVPNTISTFNSRHYILSNGVYYKPIDMDSIRLISDHSVNATYNSVHYSPTGTILYVPSYSYSNFHSSYISQRKVEVIDEKIIQVRPTFSKKLIHGDYPTPDTLRAELTKVLQLIDPNFQAVMFDITTFKFNITNVASPFSFIFSESISTQVMDVESNNGLGYILGCRTLRDEKSSLQPDFSNTLIPTSRADLSGHPYLYLYLTTEQHSITNEASTTSALNAFGRISLSVPKGSIMFFNANSQYDMKADDLNIPIMSSIRVRLGRYAYSRTRQVTLYEPQGVENSLCLRILCDIDHTGSAAPPPTLQAIPSYSNYLSEVDPYIRVNELGRDESDSYSDVSD